MRKTRVVIKKAISADGKAIAQAKSVASVSGDSQKTLSQSVSVTVDEAGNSRCYSYSATSSTQ